MTTEVLAVRAREGSGRAFEELVFRFEEPLYNFLLVRTRCSADAEELAQETFLRAWQNLARYDARWSFGTWLFTLGRRLVISRFRAAAARVPLRSLEADDGHASELDRLVEPGADPAVNSLAHEERRQLWRLADRVLGAESCSALWLRYAEELSVEEIAEVLGKRQVTVRVLLFRARSKLGEALARLEPGRHESARPRLAAGSRSAPSPHAAGGPS